MRGNWRRNRLLLTEHRCTALAARYPAGIFRCLTGRRTRFRREFTVSYRTVIPRAVDTYDVTEGVKHVVQLAREMGSDFRLSGVRLDSGDLAKHANDVRRKLDAAGLNLVKIFASSSLDEYEITRLVSAGVPIDGFGVGRHLATSSDVPALDTAYKLVEYAGYLTRARRFIRSHKRTAAEVSHVPCLSRATIRGGTFPDAR